MTVDVTEFDVNNEEEWNKLTNDQKRDKINNWAEYIERLE